MRLVVTIASLATACTLGDYRVGGDAGVDVQSADVAVADAFDGGAVTDVVTEVVPKSYRQTVLDDQPVLYLRLGEASAASPALDEVAGPNGTYQGGISFGKAGAIANDANTAVSLSGGYVNVGNYFPFPGKSPFTFEAWVRSSGSPTNTYQEIILKRDYTAGHLFGYHLFLDPSDKGCVQRFSDTGVDDTACTPAALPSTAYTHLVATYDGTTLAIYQNGSQVFSAPSSLSFQTTSSALCIGCDPFFSSPYYGLLDEVAIYDQALGAARIMAHAQAAK